MWRNDTFIKISVLGKFESYDDGEGERECGVEVRVRVEFLVKGVEEGGKFGYDLTAGKGKMEHDGGR